MNQSSKIALVAVTQRGVEQARLLRRRLRAGDIYRPERYGPALHSWESPFAGPLSELVPGLFKSCGQMVFFLAVGAVTRLIAGCLGSKETDPGVLAVDEAGRFVIPLLSGHLGGANAFARTVAGCLGAVPVITTASDAVGGLSLDLLADSFGWIAEPKDRLKEAARTLVDCQPVVIVQELGRDGEWLDRLELPANVTFHRNLSGLENASSAYLLWVTDRQGPVPVGFDRERILFYRPQSLVLGVGCERGISAAALLDGLDRFLGEQGFAKSSITAVASVDLKADEEGLVELARLHGWPTVFYSADELACVADLPNPSEVVARCVGAPGVAEPAALLAAGVKQLLAEKQVVRSPLAPQRMTFALARMACFEPAIAAAGSQEKVIFLGAGPGDPDLLTLKGRRILSSADVVVYAGSLVPEEMLRHAPATAVLHNSAHLTLNEVITCLTEAARCNKRVVRLHSGDTTLYSAIHEQMMLLDAAGIEYEVIPGISSYQAAAAALAAELTVPEVVQTVILTRAEGETPMPKAEELADLARHQATLCIFLSARLAQQVQEQLLTAYAPETPTAIAYRVTWPDEKIFLTELRHLAAEVQRHGLKRTTLILVGSALAAGRQRLEFNRSRLYDKNHGHIFRAKSREETHPSA
jgi:precorrin-4 C11-methyltransferase